MIEKNYLVYHMSIPVFLRKITVVSLFRVIRSMIECILRSLSSELNVHLVFKLSLYFPPVDCQNPILWRTREQRDSFLPTEIDGHPRKEYVTTHGYNKYSLLLRKYKNVAIESTASLGILITPSIILLKVCNITEKLYEAVILIKMY